MYFLDVSLDEYIPRCQGRSSSQPPPPPTSSSSPSPIPSIASNTASSPTNSRPLSSIIFNSSSIADDCGLVSKISCIKQLFSVKGLGLLDFDIIWREAFNILTVTLIRARSLRSADSNGLSDPYVKLHIVPGVAKVNIDIIKIYCYTLFLGH